MSKIITVTLNPSLDRTMVVHYLNPGYANRTSDRTRLDPAGRGVNVSRALSRLNVPTNAVILLGDDAVSLSYRALLDAEKLPFTPIVRDGRTRSNVVIVDTGHKSETHLVEESSVGQEDDITALLDVLASRVDQDDSVILAGDLTMEGPMDTYARLLAKIRELGAHVTLYTSGDPLKRALVGRPDRVILRQRELEALMNYPVRNTDDCVYAARSLLEKGAGEVLVLSLRDPNIASAVLVDADGPSFVSAPMDERVTSSGVEDALVAGYLSGLYNGQESDDALKLGLAAARYTVGRMGNDFGTLDDINALMPSTAEPAAV